MRQSRCVLLPFCSDAILLVTWLRCFKIWEDEVDHLYICNNAIVDQSIRDWCVAQISDSPKITMIQYERQLDHGPAINLLLDKCQENLVMLVEEDAFIFKKGQVDKCFKAIEEGQIDIVASARGSCSVEIQHRAETVWGTPAQTPNFWPNFFFISRENLLRTDRHFHAKAWYEGDYIKELGLTITDEVSPADTFVWASIQLRGLGLRVSLVDQYHSRMEDIEDRDRIRGVFDRKAPWVHIGSLSGWQNVLFGDKLQSRIGEIEEWERRCAAWLFLWEDAYDKVPESMKEFYKRYKAGIDRLITEYTLSPARVMLRVSLFRDLIK